MNTGSISYNLTENCRFRGLHPPPLRPTASHRKLHDIVPDALRIRPQISSPAQSSLQSSEACKLCPDRPPRSQSNPIEPRQTPRRNRRQLAHRPADPACLPAIPASGARPRRRPQPARAQGRTRPLPRRPDCHETRRPRLAEPRASMPPDHLHGTAPETGRARRRHSAACALPPR